jgi:hypothetical protein
LGGRPGEPKQNKTEGKDYRQANAWTRLGRISGDHLGQDDFIILPTIVKFN